MGATFARVKTWSSGEVLTAADLNAEYDNVLNNLTPAGVDDESTNAAAMQATADPYPGGAESLATSFQGEIQRLRYVIKQMSGKAQWYIDPEVLTGAAGTKVIFYQDTAPTGWTIENTLDDKLLFITKGSAAGGETGGGAHATGTWTQPNHLHTSGDFTLTTNEMPAHTHGITTWQDTGAATPGVANNDGASSSITYNTDSAGAGAAHNHGNTGNSATANTWRPAAYCAIICTKD